MTKPETPLKFRTGHEMKNRFMLAPMTNTQSFENGHLSDDEYKWLTMRSQGQFGMVMTCASHISPLGQGFPGQLAIFSDEYIEDHKRLASGIKKYGNLAVIQLHHAGMRSPSKLIGQAPVCPSDNDEFAARGMTLEEVRNLRDDFINGAVRAQKAGYDGIEVHGAHGYIIDQFLSPEVNKRDDEYGGSLDNRSRLLFEIVAGIRQKCGKEFLLGVRLSPDKTGTGIHETKAVCQSLIDEGNTDFLDISLWDCFKYPEDEKYSHKTLLEHFTDLDLKDVRYTVAGNIRKGRDIQKILDAGVHFAAIGRSGILHHDFPVKVLSDPDFEPIKLPVSKQHLINEGLGDKFLEYISRWEGFMKN